MRTAAETRIILNNIQTKPEVLPVCYITQGGQKSKQILFSQHTVLKYVHKASFLVDLSVT